MRTKSHLYAFVGVLAWHYERGLGVPKYPRMALLLNHRAAQKGNLAAVRNLGTSHTPPLHASTNLSLSLFSLSLSPSYLFSLSRFSLALSLFSLTPHRLPIVTPIGLFYSNGIGMDQKDDVKAYHFLKAAAAADRSVNAIFSVGTFYERGLVPSNESILSNSDGNATFLPPDYQKARTL